VTPTTYARRAILLALSLLGIFLPPAALAATSAKLSGTFVPEHLGERTTLDFSFIISDPGTPVPPPLVQVELSYPNYLGIGLSGLGLATCTAPVLEAGGPTACAPNAIMGYGETLTGIILGTTTIHENAPITILRTPDQEGRFSLLFYAEGTTPVNTRILFPGLLLPASAPFGGKVSIGVPLVPTLPGAPDISVLELHATLGPHRVLYSEQTNGKTLRYRPTGILLPPRCPRGGFPFAAQFSFNDGSIALARTAVPCPAQAARRKQAVGKRR
jgi:hypothetical protein